MSYHITSHHTTSHHITSHHITSHHITSHHITSHHITPTAGARVVRDLAARSDVLIENFVGKLDTLGLGYDALSAVHPGLVYCSVTGYGRNGPYASVRASGP